LKSFESKDDWALKVLWNKGAGSTLRSSGHRTDEALKSFEKKDAKH